MRRLTDGERDVLHEAEKDARETMDRVCDRCGENVPDGATTEPIYDAEQDVEQQCCPACVAEFDMSVELTEVGGVPVRVLEQFDHVRRTGLTNMMDRNNVQQLAHTFDCYQLVEWIEAAGRRGYPRLLVAFKEWKGED